MQAAGRDHNAKADDRLGWRGGGVKAGHVVGSTDELGNAGRRGRASDQDLHVTLLPCWVSQQPATYFHEGRYKQLSQVGGAVIKNCWRSAPRRTIEQPPLQSSAWNPPAGHFEQHLTRFGLAAFRPGQREVISAILSRRIVLCIMPTAAARACVIIARHRPQRTALVVSPLIALMKDQSMPCKRQASLATFLTLPLAVRAARANGPNGAGGYDLVYIAPEAAELACFWKSCD